MHQQSHFRISLGILALTFVALLILALAACGSTTSQQTTAPTLTPTTQPTVQKPTPTHQASIQDQLQNIVRKSGAAYVGDATVNYDAGAKYAHIFENFPSTGDNSLDVGRIKQDAFAIQKAIWQAHISSVDAVQVIFNDATSQQRLATSEVERTTATKLNWASMTSDQAWSSYDTAWLSPSL
jgi:hypothetical protein